MASDYLTKLFGLDGQVIVVTGGGGVLGGAIAHGLAQAGAQVVVLGHTAGKVESMAASIVAEGGQASAVEADVLDSESLRRALDAVLARYGRVDGLLNAAGGNKAAATTSASLSFFDLPEDALRWVFDLNFVGTLLPIQVFGRALAEQGGGAIVNIASVNSFRPLTNVVAYSAAKSAVKNLTEWLAVHLAQNYAATIRVNAIAPGFFLTAQNEYLLVDESGNPTARGQQIMAHTPLGRYGRPDELVSTAIWLFSPAASFVHGATILVDGGYCAFGGV